MRGAVLKQELLCLLTLKLHMIFVMKARGLDAIKTEKAAKNRFTPTRKTNTEHSCANTITSEKGMGIFFPPAVPGNVVQ